MKPDPAHAAPVTTDATAAAAGVDTPAGRYIPGEEIARGGMGVVFRATDAVLGREVAVKVLQGRFEPSSGTARRFADEARITARLQHPAVPPVHDLGVLPDGRPFLAMKLIEGETLDTLLKARPDPAADRGRFVAAFEQVCQAVAYAHSRGVIHRDLKPSNVMVGAFGEVQVMDWGLAKVLDRDREPAVSRPAGATASPHPGDPERTTDHHPADESTADRTRAGQAVGTPAYMPPEQARGEVDRIDRRADVFALGGVLCAILTGKPPYTGARAAAVLEKAAAADLGDALTRLGGCGADAELVALCSRCLAPDPADRPADAGEVAAAVAAYRAGQEERLRAAERERAAAEAEAREQRKRRRWQLALAGAVGLILVGLGAFLWWQDRQETARRTEAENREREDREKRGRTAEAASALLTRAEEGLRANDAARAGVALDAAARQAREGGVEDLSGRVERLRTALSLLQKLDEIDRFRWTQVGGRWAEDREVARRLREALTGAGLLPNGPPDPAARAAASPIGGRVVAALDLALVLDPKADVRAVLRGADPDPAREAFRDAVLAGDEDRVGEFAGRVDPGAHPPEFVAALCAHPGVEVERRRELLRAAAARRSGAGTLWMALCMTYDAEEADGTDEKLTGAYAAVAALPGNPAAHNTLGAFLIDRKNTDGGVAYLREALRLDPDYAPARVNLGLALRRKKDSDGALACMQEAVSRHPGYAAAHHALGAVLSDRREYDAALPHFREAIRLDPEHREARDGLGMLLRKNGDRAGAVAAHREAVRLDPGHAKSHTNLGLALQDAGDVEGALAAHREAVRLDPKSPTARASLGAALRRSGDLPGAVAEGREAVRLDPGAAEAHDNLGLALWASKDLDGAIAAHREAARLDPTYAPARTNLGMALYQKGDPDGAIAAYREALKLDPKLAGARSNLAVALKAKGDLAGAIAAYREALELDPRDARIHYNLAVTLKAKGDVPGAEAAYREAIRLDPKNPRPRNNLGVILQERGDLDAALVYFEEAARLDPGNPARKQTAEAVRRLKADRDAGGGHVAPPPREAKRP